MNENKIISSIYQKIEAQQAKGLKKYGKEVHTDSHSLREWLQHAQEETLDKAVYLETEIQKLAEVEEKLRQMYDHALKKEKEAIERLDYEARRLFRERGYTIWQCGRLLGIDVAEKEKQI